ncbi:MAG: diguanylate cyclase [Oceanospirillaceae bacterium]|nr:diguanylate cyclase [Oceanospirillaceae bacterium]
MIKPLFNRMKIASKIVFLLVAISSISVLFATLSFITYEFYSAREQAQKNVELISNIVSQNMVAAVAFDDRESVMQLLNMLKADKSIVYAQVRNSHNEIIASYKDADFSTELTAMMNSDYLIFNKPLYLDADLHGNLLIISDNVNFRSQIKAYLLVAFLVLCSSIFVSLILSFRLQKSLSNPILTLSEFSKEIRDSGNYKLRVNIDSKDEIGELAKIFNQMLVHIQSRDLKLEEDVAKRTIELSSANKKLAHLAFHDNLTGLPNRILLEDRMQQAIKKLTRNPNKIVLLFIDMDGFKQVNDLLGHAAGDELLKDTAKQLSVHCRAEDTIARFGGDEFIMLITQHKNQDIAGLCQRIINSFNRFIQQREISLDVTLSIGVAYYGQHGKDFDTLKNYADAAMYQVKHNGKNGFMISKEQHHES